MSHGIGFLLAVAALPVIVHAATQRGRAADVVAASLFATTMILLYGVSTLNHALPGGRGKAWLNRLDMPFLLGVLHGAWGWSLFGVVWAAAALGVVSKLLDRLRHPLWSTSLYVAMGWMVLIAAVPLFERMSASGLAWLVAGGVSCPLGAVVYLFDSKLRYAHFVWHLFVMGGSACHFCAALWHAAA